MATKKPIYIHVIIGHSIIDGSNKTNWNNLQPELKIAMPNVKIFNILTRAIETMTLGTNNRNIGTDASKLYGPELQYGYNQQLYDSKICYVYKRGISGSGVTANNSVLNWNYAFDMHYIDQCLFDLKNFRDALIVANTADYEIKYKIAIWLGANDSLGEANFKTNLTNLILQFRHNLGASVPIALDRYVNAGARRTACIEIASEQPSVYLVNSDDLTYPDGTHPTQPEIWGARAQDILKDKLY